MGGITQIVMLLLILYAAGRQTVSYQPKVHSREYIFNSLGRAVHRYE
jgi:hypothetical protein